MKRTYNHGMTPVGHVLAPIYTSALVGLGLVIACCFASGAVRADISLEVPKVVHIGQSFELVVIPSESPADTTSEELTVKIGGTTSQAMMLTGVSTELASLSFDSSGPVSIQVSAGEEILINASVQVIPGWMSVIPPLIAIGLALWLKSVIPAIFVGLWAGLVVQDGFSLENVGQAFMDIFAVNIVDVLEDRGHISLLLFTAMIGGMVGVVSSNGGMHGVVNIVIRWANTRKRGQQSVFFLGLCIFFDDYTNTLVVGNAVRPLTDRLKISRQKLAYLVDSTAAPVACIAIVTTWIGYELGLIGDAVAAIEGFDEPAYSIFLNSIPYSFYPLLAIFFVYLISSSGRDFGPMLRAEQKARRTEQKVEQDIVESKEPSNTDTIPARAVNAVLPIVTLIAGGVGGMVLTGEGSTLRDILSTADVYLALMWASFLSAAVAGGLTVAQRLLSLEDTVQAWLKGANFMVPPLVILVLAWALSGLTSVLGTADFLVSLGGDLLVPALIPAIAFLISAAAAFATGSSWGVMAIILPLIIPVTWSSLEAGGGVTADNMHILYSAIASVLAGSVWGDHCSPISDTTILSSLASGCDHIEHVRTQLPYALSVGLVCLIAGTIPVGMGMPWWLALIICAAILIAIVRLVGKPLED